LRILFPLGAAILALTGALAACCFAKVYGIVFLGKARDENLPELTEVGWGGRSSQVLLALLCVICGLAPMFAISIFNAVPVELIGAGLPLQHSSWWWLVPTAQIVVGGKGVVATTAYSALLVGSLLVVILILLYFVIARTRNLARIKPWDCGYGGLTSAMQYTSTAFTMPIRRVFHSFWRIREDKQLTHHTKQPLAVEKIAYHIDIDDWFWVVLYEPWQKIIDKLSSLVAKVQSGSLRLYLTYIFVILVLLLWLICYK
jgi:hypothetical protein